MTLPNKQKILKVSVALIIVTVIINIICFTFLPSNMILRTGKSGTLPKIILLVALPLMSYLVFNVAREDEHPKSSMFNILGQIILFVTNLFLLYINLV